MKLGCYPHISVAAIHGSLVKGGLPMWWLRSCSKPVRGPALVAVIKINPEDKAVLRAEGFVTRDPRAVERKKPGRPKARKRFQFSKR